MVANDDGSSTVCIFENVLDTTNFAGLDSGTDSVVSVVVSVDSCVPSVVGAAGTVDAIGGVVVLSISADVDKVAGTVCVVGGSFRLPACFKRPDIDSSRSSKTFEDFFLLILSKRFWMSSVFKSGKENKEMSRLVGKPTMWFPNRSETNRPVQARKRARSLKFRI